MKYIITTILQFFVFSLFVLNPNYSFSSDYRKKLDLAYNDKKYTQTLLDEIESTKSTVNNGFKAMVYITYSKHLTNPFSKVKQFNKGKEILEKQIRSNPNNIEWIYYRYNIQLRIPKILNYDNKKEDVTLLKKFVQNEENKKLDFDLYQRISSLF